MRAWNDINEAMSFEKLMEDMVPRITPDTYGFDEGQWNITDSIREATAAKSVVDCILSGTLQGGDRNQTGPLKSYDGRPMVFKLKVLTRQACSLAADGKHINGWSAGRKCKGQQTPENTIFPEADEAPKPGDVVKIKLGMKHGMNVKKRDALLARGQSPYDYISLPVDADGCIICEYTSARQVLGKAGKRMVFPEFRRQDHSLIDATVKHGAQKQRQITRWYFEEVPMDYHVEKPVPVAAPVVKPIEQPVVQPVVETKPAPTTEYKSKKDLLAEADAMGLKVNPQLRKATIAATIAKAREQE